MARRRQVEEVFKERLRRHVPDSEAEIVDSTEEPRLPSLAEQVGGNREGLRRPSER